MKKYILITLLVIIFLIVGCGSDTEISSEQEEDSEVSIEISGIDEIETDLNTDDLEDFEEDLANFDF